MKAIKGLKVLAFLASKGGATVREVALGLAIPEPTAARLLETLRSEGFAMRARARRQYWVTSRLAILAQSVPPLPLIVEISGTHLDDLSAALNVPAMICSLSGPRRLEVLRSNLRSVKPAITRFVPGYTFPMQDTASGLVMAAFGGAQALEPRRTAAKAEKRGANGSDVRLVRRRGYAITDNRLEQRESCLAVPILIDARACACLEIRYMKALASEATIEKQYLPVLRRHANEIAIGASAWL